MAGGDVTVRIGLRIREEGIQAFLDGRFSVTDGNGQTHHLADTSLQANVHDPSQAPRFGQRLQTFTDPEKAALLARTYKAHGVACRVIQLGREVEWGRSGLLKSDSYAVVTGDEASESQAVQLGRDVYDKMPLLADRERPAGWKKYKDQLLAPDPIRLTPPSGGTLLLRLGNGESHVLASPVRIRPLDEKALFRLSDVRIGIDFHWDHRETLSFRGDLEVVADGAGVTAVNEVELDTYLAAVLGSEMRPDWPVEALAAQSVAARSTVLATRGRHHFGEAFELCHDDHCQCYQGVGREGNTAKMALARVEGQLLAYGNRVADARYAKSCGGIADHYHVAWDDEDIPYLQPVPCGPLDEAREAETLIGNQAGELTLDRFLAHPPEWAACNPKAVPYPDSCRDMEQLYRWSRKLSEEQLSALITSRTGRDLGKFESFQPLEYGVSGRIRYLKVNGTNGSVVVGRELAIRRLLSDTHLPSSAFKLTYRSGEGVTIEGIGWGHGVGLCQLGAATLAGRGWDAQRLLMHYYPGARIIHRGFQWMDTAANERAR